MINPGIVLMTLADLCFIIAGNSFENDPIQNIRRALLRVNFVHILTPEGCHIQVPLRLVSIHASRPLRGLPLVELVGYGRHSLDRVHVKISARNLSYRDTSPLPILNEQPDSEMM